MDQKQPGIFDTIVIGAGPAGIAAAIYAARKNLKTLILTKDIGGQAAFSKEIENYPGFTLITGENLAQKFREELVNFENRGLWVKEGVEVTELSGADGQFLVKTADNNQYQGKTIIIASGRIPRMLNIPGEKEFLGKGVVICTACEMSFYEGKDVVIVGGGNSALDAAHSLEKVVKSITIINITEELRGDEILLKNVTSSPKVKVLNNHEAIEILGDKYVGGVKVKNTQSQEEEVIPVSGVFIEIGWTPSTSFDQLTEKNGKGEIEVDEFGATSVPGIYACGDVNDLWGEQIVIAAGEGAKTALVVTEHLSKIPHQESSNIHHS